MTLLHTRGPCLDSRAHQWTGDRLLTHLLASTGPFQVSLIVTTEGCVSTHKDASNGLDGDTDQTRLRECWLYVYLPPCTSPATEARNHVVLTVSLQWTGEI